MDAITGLAAVITAARAGSISHAMRLFEAGGWSAETGNASAMAIRARLLKDAALMETGPARSRMLGQAADAYRSADALRPQPYTRINEASMRLLAGDRTGARDRAQALLAWMNEAEDLAETPYYIHATRAEACLLCDDPAGAQREMALAVAADPDGWADRASTLRQLALILAATGGVAAWLDAFRPPATLNYAGHLGVSAEAGEALRAQVAAWVRERGIGFGFGALAAGADIVMAEALLECGAELHVLLPVAVDSFVAQSVAPYGAHWLARFEACRDAAQSLHCATALDGAYEPLATQLAADVAMGASVLHARQLQTEAWQLLVIDDAPGPFGAGLGTRGIGERWRDAARRHCLVVPRTAPVRASGDSPVREGRADRRLAALLLVALDTPDPQDEAAFATAIDEVIAPFHAACAAIAPRPDLMLATDRGQILAFADPDAALAHARAVLALRPALPLRVAGHYGLAHRLDDPPLLTGRAVAELGAVAASALPGVLTASAPLASVLAINHADNMIAEHIGEAGGHRLFAVTPLQ